MGVCVRYVMYAAYLSHAFMNNRQDYYRTPKLHGKQNVRGFRGGVAKPTDDFVCDMPKEVK